MTREGSGDFISVKLLFQGEKQLVKSLYEALYPDNRIPPRNVSITDIPGENTYSIELTGGLDGRTIDSIRQCVDEILAIASMIRRSVAEKNGLYRR